MLGFAFPSLSQFQALPPIYNAFQQGLLDKPIFTVYLQKRGNLNHVPGGVFTYGGLDIEHCSTEINYYPLSRSTYYQFTIDSVNFWGVTTGVGISGPWKTISDTGTSFMYGPTKIVKQFAEMAGATFNEENGIYDINCNATFGDLKFLIGDKWYSIKSEKLIIKHGKNQCWFGFFGKDGFTQWNFGDPWICSYCNIYDMGNQIIGFAKIIAQNKHFKMFFL
uniref:Peptidase A1 domain-containing protein n=1 Tax=Panagrolaimus sp. PS1159 TaxID=55785 RepID=A0AC35EV58_9BILA